MKKLLYILLFIALSFLCYGNVLGTWFLSDDHQWLDAYRSDLLTLLKNNFTDAFFLPLTHFAEFFAFRIFGYNAKAYHVMTLLLHTVNAMLAGLLLKRIFRFYKIKADNSYLFYFAGLLFLTLPYQTEAVTWYSAKSYVIATFLFLIAFICYLKYKENGKQKHILISFTAFALSLFTKEITIVFPLIIVLFELTSGMKGIKKKLILTGIYFGLLALYLLIRYFVLGAIIGGYNEEVHLNFSLKILLYNYLLYFIKFFVFFRYLPMHTTPVYLLIVILFVALFILFVRRMMDDKDNYKAKLMLIVVMVFFFVILLLPVINLETTSLTQVQSDRYGYLPSLAAVFIIAVFIEFLSRNRIFKNIVYACLVIIFTYFTINTNKLWHDAGLKAEKIVNSIIKQTTASTSDLYIINAPDNYHGIYMFRAGLKEAVYSIDSRTAPVKMHILAYQINNSNLKASLSRNDSNTYTIALPAGDSFVNKNSDTLKYRTVVKVLHRDNTHIEFQIPFLDNPSSENLFLYYDNDMMQRVR